MNPSRLFSKDSSMSALVFVLLCGAIIIFDSIIVRLYANLSAEQPPLVNLLLFDGLVIFLILANYVPSKMVQT